MLNDLYTFSVPFSCGSRRSLRIVRKERRTRPATSHAVSPADRAVDPDMFSLTGQVQAACDTASGNHPAGRS